MAADILSREQRLRKQAELQTLYTNLASLRDREASYIEAAAPVPELFLKQINELRHQIVNTENELVELDSENNAESGQEAYHKAFEAELNQNYSEAIKLYRKAARHSYPDANAAVRSARYLNKRADTNKSDSGQMWMPSTTGSSRKLAFIGAGVVLILILIIIFTLFGRTPGQTQEAIAVESTATSTAIPTDLSAPTATPTNTATGTPLPTNTLVPLAPAQSVPVDTPTPVPASTTEPVPTLRPPPKVIGPKNGLVWGDGAIVFEFEDFKLGYDELYCLNVLRGYDTNNAENWSFESVGEKRPRIAIDANAFHVAKAQDIQCIVWSAYIARQTCENVISGSSEERIIGLPRPCDFEK